MTLTGSQPVVAEKPFVLQPGLSPLVISLRAPGFAYNQGLSQPSRLLPALKSSSFRRETMLAKMGLAQLVPPTRYKLPLQAMITSSACAATSGKPRPLGLYKPLYVLPRVARYADTSADWKDGVE